MKASLKKIKKESKAFFDAHDMVNEFHFGDFIRIYSENQIKHSSVIMQPIRATQMGRRKTPIQLLVTYSDRVYSDFRNLDDVHSQALEVLDDFVHVINSSGRWRGFLNGNTTADAQTFTQRSGDLVAGAAMTITLDITSVSDLCAIPTDGYDYKKPAAEVANYTVEYEDGTFIKSGIIPIGSTTVIKVPNCDTCDVANWTLTDSFGVVLDTGTIASGGSATIEAPNGTSNIKQSDGTLLQAVTIPSGGTVNTNIADSVITVNSATFASVKATDSLNVPVVDSNGDAVATTVVGSNVQVDDLPCASSGTGATLMRTGETTSFRTGDDFDKRNDGRAVDFITLEIANPFGNFKRFTGTTGGYKEGGVYYDKDGVVTTQALAFPATICMDWSTYGRNDKVLGWYLGSVPAELWNDAIDNALALTVGGFVGWKIPNRTEGYSIISRRPSGYGQEPFDDIDSGATMSVVWTSTTDAASAAYITTSGQAIITRGKTSSSWSFRCRVFTVTGTTLT